MEIIPGFNNLPDVVVGCIQGYAYKDIEPWVVSLERSGFKGDRYMIIYPHSLDGFDKSLIVKLYQKGFKVLTVMSQPVEHIVVDRFLRLWNLINMENFEKKYNRIISTDVRDVVFQTNPSEWLDKNLKAPYKINVSSECLEYQHEPWGDSNMRNSFPDVYETMKNRVIYNAGTIAGEISAMKDFFLNIYLLSRNNKYVHNPDQAALNVLLSFDVYDNITRFSQQEDGWCTQLGTTGDSSKKELFEDFLKEPVPTFKHDGTVVNQKGEPFCLVHQYDRNNFLRELIDSKFRE